MPVCKKHGISEMECDCQQWSAEALAIMRAQELADRAKVNRDGVPAVEATVFDKFDTRNPNVVAGNDDG